MIGWTHVCVCTLISRKYGHEVLQKILQDSGYEPGIEFNIQTYYEDSETMRIFRVAALVIGITVDEMWEMYGEFLITYACETGWHKMLVSMANNVQEFFDNLNSMHYFIDQIAFKSEMKGPTFECESLGDDSLKLHYLSNRQGLYPIVKGLLRKSVRILFDMELTITVVERNQEKRRGGTIEHVAFVIEPDEEHSAGKKLAYKFKPPRPLTSRQAVNRGLPITIRDYRKIFPYHICFNKQLIVEHIGNFLLIEYGLATKKMLKLSDVVQLIQPSDIQLTYKNILGYLNTLFIFQLKMNSVRFDEECDATTLQQPLLLKGEMMPMADGLSIMFICSPYVTTVRDIINLKLFISDMPIHDATRDLVMLNQSRICQMELNKKLEETIRTMKKTAEELESKKQQRDRLLFEFVPPVVAQHLRASKAVSAQEFKECTVVFTDIADFFTISVNCSPMEIIQIVTDLFHRFDRIIELHKGYKVLSLMDSYLIVGGCPTPNPLHCEDSLNLVLGLLYESRQVIVPKLEQCVRIRVGVHCGPIVAGIVSQQKPRFCVLGNTVQIAKSICSSTQPGRALVSNSVRTMVTKHLKSIFVFTSNGYIDLKTNGKIMTHFLDKNEQTSIWDIVQKTKEENMSIDGYRELDIDRQSEVEWSNATTAAYRAVSIVDALDTRPSRTKAALTRLQSIKKKFKSNDSGVSVNEPAQESTLCNIM